MAATDNYTAGNLSVLEGLDAVRKRPGMYIGSTDSAGLTHCLIEIVDNSADEAAAGFARSIGVSLGTSPLHATVIDDGRGIPVDVNAATGLSGVELVLTKLHAGGKFDGGSYAAAGGLHGVGGAVVNALSTTLTAKVTRDGGVFEQTFHHGAAAGPLQRIGNAAKSRHGTTIAFTPDTDLFTPDATWDVAVVATRLNHLTHLLPGVSAWLEVDGERTEFAETSGLSDLLTTMVGPDGAAAGPVTIHAENTFTERVPVLRDGSTVVEDVLRKVVVDVALAWSARDGDTISYVNTISTPGGGTHMVGLDRALPKVFAAAARPGDPLVTKDDIAENMMAVVRVQLPEPQFSGQTKEVLATREVTAIVADAVFEQFSAWMSARRNKEQVKVLLDLVANNAKARVAAKDARDARRTHAKLTRAATLPAKLVDCRSRDITRNELLLVEGDSALGTVKGARDSETQAALPLRGKILNTARASEKQMLANAECAAIISVMGTGAGKNFNIDKLRYGKLVFLSVVADTPTLYRDHITGEVHTANIGDLVDSWCERGDDYVPCLSVPSLSKETGEVSWQPVSGYIRHPYSGTLVTVTTASGRHITVTANHSLCIWDPQRGYRNTPASDIEVGDNCVIPSNLTLAADPRTRLDLVELLRHSDYGHAIRVEGPGAARVASARVRSRFPSNRGVEEARISLPLAVWRDFAAVRAASGYTLTQTAHALGFAQAATISAYETGRGTPTLSTFSKYLQTFDLNWPDEAEVLPSHLERWSEGRGSAHEKYKQSASVIWLDSLTEDEVSLLGDDVELHVRNFSHLRLPRMLPIDESLGLLLGWLTAEGSFSSRGTMRLTLGDNDQPYLPELQSAIESVCGFPAKRYRSSEPRMEHTFSLHIHHGLLSRVTRALGMGTTSHFKHVPDPVLNATEPVRLAYLRGLYLGDGNKRGHASVAITTMSDRLAEDVSHLLTSLGCPPHVRKQAARNTVTGKYHGQAKTIVVSEPAHVGRLRPVWEGSADEDLREKRVGRQRAAAAGARITDTAHLDPVVSVDSRNVVDEDVYDLSVPGNQTFAAGHHGLLLASNSDADVDGAHIRCLLLTLVYRYMRPLLEQNRVFTAVPPLHMIKVGSGKKAAVHYTYSDDELREFLKTLKADGVTLKDDSIQRYKGLGEMDADQLAETTLDPAHRRLRRITMADAAAASAMFDLCMGPDAAARRDFIISRAPELDPAHLDT